jgi:feruloyl-CoA synthase
VAEDFKLLTGTWVSTGALRVAAIAACAPLVQDAVVTGHDRDEIGLLVFPSPGACAALAGKATGTPIAELVCEAAVHAAIRAGLERHNSANPAGSTRIARALVLREPPVIDADEITDKGGSIQVVGIATSCSSDAVNHLRRLVG